MRVFRAPSEHRLTLAVLSKAVVPVVHVCKAPHTGLAESLYPVRTGYIIRKCIDDC
jgi:hypothetical protein